MSWILAIFLVIFAWNAQAQGQIYKDVIKTGTGAGPQKGDRVVVHYVGNLKSNGKKFDSSRDRNDPFKFTLFGNEVITGWDYSVQSMKVGERARFEIPSLYAYGASGAPPDIPPNADLIFDIELLGIERPANPQQRPPGRP